MTLLIRGSQSFFSLFRPCRLLSRRMLCDSPAKPVPLSKTHETGKAPILQHRAVQQINDSQLLAKLEKMYKAQSEDQNFKEITYENMVHAIAESSDVNPVVFLLSKGIPPPIPGLVYQPDFLVENVQQSLYAQALRLNDKICTHIHFEDTPGRKINAQNFVDYGSPGHELTYFINNQNIPNFIHEELISRINQMKPVQVLASQTENSLNWRFIFNVFKEQGAKQARFD